MKKLIFTSALAIAALFSTATYASGGYWDHDGWEGHHGHHHHHHWQPQYREVIRYYPPRPQYREVINYYPAPPRPRPIYREEIHYYPQPQPQSYNYQDGRNTSGLAGGVVGGVMGYQFGNGDPLATGIGAAAGAMIGNGFDGR